MAGNDSSTVLLLHFNGTNASTTFTDSAIGGSAPHTMTANGNAQISTAQSQFGGAAGLFDGSGDYVSTPNSSDFDLTGDFTIDCWIRRAATGAEHNIVSHGDVTSNNMLLRIDSADKIDFFIRDGSSNVIGRCQGATSVTANAWHHVAYVRNGSSFVAYLDGTSDATASTATAGGTYSALLKVGMHPDGSTGGFNGYIDELRISKGVARWTANFTPPTAEYSTNVSGAGRLLMGVG